MNELKAVFGDYSWIYWKTYEENCGEAIEELLTAMENNNVNVDYLTVVQAELRDENENIIDEY